MEWNLLSAIRDAVITKASRGYGYQFLVPALAYANAVSANELCILARDMRAQSHWNGWTLHQPTTALFQRDSALGLESLKYILDHREEFTDDDVSTFATALGLAQPDAAFDDLLILCRSPSESNRQAGLIGLRATADGGHVTRLNAVAVEIRQIAERDTNGSPTVSGAAWNMLCRLCLVEPLARERIERAAVEGSKEALTAICKWLSIFPAVKGSEDIAPRLFVLLLDVATHNAVSRREIDGSLGLLLMSSPFRSKLLDLCDALNVPAAQLDLQTEFPSIFAALTQTPGIFGRVISRWLLSESFSAVSLQSLLQAGYLNPSLVAPEITAFAAADQRSRRRALRRLLGLSVQGAPVCQLVFSLAEANDLQPWGMEMFRDVFTNYMLVEFPGPARHFLEEKRNKLDPQSALGTAVIQVLKALNDWDDVLKGLPNVKELRPSADKRAALRGAHLRQQRAMLKEVEARSIWTQIATPLRVKQGRRVISRAMGRAPQAIEMKTHIQSLEFPASEIADPLWGHRMRMLYLSDEQ
jgi:hypothetical protein